MPGHQYLSERCCCCSAGVPRKTDKQVLIRKADIQNNEVIENDVPQGSVFEPLLLTIIRQFFQSSTLKCALIGRDIIVLYTL